MSRSNWFCWLRRPARDSRRKPQRALVRERFRPPVEVLEDRTLLSAYLVNVLGDAGQVTGAYSGDLRYCITQANSDPTPNTITFDPSILAPTGGPSPLGGRGLEPPATARRCRCAPHTPQAQIPPIATKAPSTRLAKTNRMGSHSAYSPTVPN